MSTLSLRLPDSLHELARKIAKEEHVSVNQLISTAVAEKLSALATETYLRERAERGNKAAYLQVLAKVPARAPDPGDEVD